MQKRMQMLKDLGDLYLGWRSMICLFRKYDMLTIIPDIINKALKVVEITFN